jgi:hypothetical protein
MSEIDKSGVWPDEDRMIYVPDELFHRVHRVLDQMEQVNEELRKTAETRLPPPLP